MNKGFTGNPIAFAACDEYVEDRQIINVELSHINNKPFDIDPNVVHRSVGVNVNLNLNIECDADLDRLDILLSRLSRLS